MTREKITTEHTPDGWKEQIENYASGGGIDIYARTGYPELKKREKDFAEMVGAPDTALFNAGMAAIHTAIEAEDLKPGDVVLCGRDVYSQTKNVYESLEKRGIKIELIDSGDMDEIKEKIKTERPRLVILEDVANAATMQVADVKKLIEFSEEANERYQTELTSEKLLEKYFSSRVGKYGTYDKIQDELKEEIVERIGEFKEGGNALVFKDIVEKLKNIAGISNHEAVREVARIVKFVIGQGREKLSLIIDNTLASPNLYNPIKELGDSDVEMVVVESGTKHFQEGNDKITLGIVYSKNKEKITAIKAKRAEIGTYLQPNDEKEIPKDITEVMPEIMRRHAKNAEELAGILSKINNITEVSHPNLSEHEYSELANKIAPDGLVSLFWIKVPDAPAFVKRVHELGGGKIGIGGSFGHKKTWLMNLGDETVRIAAGSENDDDFQKVMDAFKEAAKEL